MKRLSIVLLYMKKNNNNNSKITGVHFTRKNYFSISKLFLCNCIKYWLQSVQYVDVI